MGQRLNIGIVKGDKLLANSYYHWSGFTRSALNLTLKIIDHKKRIEEEKHNNDILYAVRLLSVTGARLTKDQIPFALSLDKIQEFEPAINRNDGLISILAKDMEETRSWEEGRVTIDIENDTVDFSVYWTSSIEDYEEESEKSVHHLFELNHDIEDPLSFEQFIELSETISYLMHLNQNDVYIDHSDPYVLTFIE